MSVENIKAIEVARLETTAQRVVVFKVANHDDTWAIMSKRLPERLGELPNTITCDGANMRRFAEGVLAGVERLK